MKKILILIVSLLIAIQLSAYDFAYTAEDGNAYCFDLLEGGKLQLVKGMNKSARSAALPEIVAYQGNTYKISVIGTSAFWGCFELKEITLPSSIETIEHNAFGWCSALTSIHLGSNVAEIKPYAFQGCSSLQCISVDNANPYFMSVDGVLMDKSQTCLVAYPGGKAGSYYAPASISKVTEGCFYDCLHLTAIQLPLNVESIGRNAYYYCGGINSVAIPESVVDIRRGAFGECAQLAAFAVSPTNGSYATDGHSLFAKQDSTLVQFAPYSADTYEVPAWIRHIGAEAFFRCYDLASIALPQGVHTIGDAAFTECWSLQSINLPASIDSIGFAAFALCENLQSVYVSNSDPSSISLDECAFYGLPRNAALYVPTGSGDAYRKAQGWKDFSIIKEYETLSPQEIVWDQDLSDCHVGEAVWLDAEATSGLAVEYAFVEGENLATLSGGRLRFVRPGIIKLQARQNGNANYLAATPVTRTINVQVASAADPDISGITIIGGEGIINIYGAESDDLTQIYTVDGMLIYQGRSRSVLAQPGIYIVKAGKATAKTMVR